MRRTKPSENAANFALAVIGHDLLWELARITFGDERCVPPDDRQSNFRMARETLLGPWIIRQRFLRPRNSKIEIRESIHDLTV